MKTLNKKSDPATNTLLTFAAGSCSSRSTYYTCSPICKDNGQVDYYSTMANQ